MSTLSPQWPRAKAIKSASSAITYDTPQPELRLASNGSLELQKGEGAREWVPVTPVRCFPWSDATRFVSLRGVDNRELWLVEQVDDLSGVSRTALLSALQVAGFLLEVTEVFSIEEDFEIRAWKVMTASGPRSFQTERDSWPNNAPGGGHMIQDVAGDVFFIPPLATLNTQSQKLLWPYVD